MVHNNENKHRSHVLTIINILVSFVSPRDAHTVIQMLREYSMINSTHYSTWLPLLYCTLLWLPNVPYLSPDWELGRNQLAQPSRQPGTGLG